MKKQVKAIDLISFSHLSTYLTRRNDIIRKGRIGKKYKDKVRELELVIDYWMNKNNLC